MSHDRIGKNNVIFLAFLLLAGAAYYFAGSKNLLFGTVMFTINYMIYLGLLLSWVLHVYHRLLPSRTRSYIMAAAFFMILYLLLRVYKYRVCINSIFEARYLSYAYYCPMTLIPALFLMVCIRIRVYENKEPDRSSSSDFFWQGWADERLLLLPSLTLSALFLTNDLHFLVYVPQIPLSSFCVRTGTYSYGPVFYVAYIWMILCALTGLILLIVRARRFGKRAVLTLSVLLSVWLLLYIANNLMSEGNYSRPYHMPEIYIFGMLGLFEVCIQQRLIPHNENYQGFFSRLSLPVMITDRQLRPVLQTSMKVKGSAEDLAGALRRPVYPDEDTRLSGMKIRAGYVFYEENERELRLANEELRDANEVLSMENEIIRREQELIREKARIEESSRLYRKVSQEVYPVQLKISRRLSQAQAGGKNFRDKVARALMLTVYVKRKANFVMLEAERDWISAQEMISAIKETAYYMGYGGISISVEEKTGKNLPVREAIALYDCLEILAETLYDRTSSIWVSLGDEALLLMADTPGSLSFPPMPAPVRQTWEDGQLIIRILRGGERQ